MMLNGMIPSFDFHGVKICNSNKNKVSGQRETRLEVNSTFIIRARREWPLKIKWQFRWEICCFLTLSLPMQKKAAERTATFLPELSSDETSTERHILIAFESSKLSDSRCMDEKIFYKRPTYHFEHQICYLFWCSNYFNFNAKTFATYPHAKVEHYREICLLQKLSITLKTFPKFRPHFLQICWPPLFPLVRTFTFKKNGTYGWFSLIFLKFLCEIQLSNVTVAKPEHIELLRKQTHSPPAQICKLNICQKDSYRCL